MFEELRSAWRQAVENFHRELRAGATSPDSERLLAMRRDLAAAAAALGRIETECRRARDELVRERDQEGICRRREQMARRIDDDETADVAAAFAEKHAERARVLEQVVAALGGECDLRRSDVAEMRRRLDAIETAADAPQAAAENAASGGNGGNGFPPFPGSFAEDNVVFRELEREARERAAEARLEELKREAR